MTQYPLSTDLQSAYRSALGIADSPSFVDTGVPITPVAIIGQANVASTAQFQKLTDGTDNLNINSDGSLPVSPQSKGTTVVDGNKSGVGSTTVATVTAAKKWYVTQVISEVGPLGAIATPAQPVFTLGSLNLHGAITGVCAASPTNATLKKFDFSSSPLILNAGDTITVSGATNVQHFLTVVYYEV